MQPYLGMTDVPSADWLRERLRTFVDAGGEMLEHRLHAGVMMSWKSLHVQPTKYADVWPRNEGIAGIFVRDPRVLNVLHYADDDGRTTMEDFERAVEFGGPALDGLQLDMPWPDVALVSELRRKHEQLRIILQVGGRALREVGHGLTGLRQRLDAYGDAVDDVLLDLSGGKGLPLTAGTLLPYVEELRRIRPGLGLAVAGGLGPHTLDRVQPLVRRFPKLSIDAQGQLRRSGSSLDPIEADRADAYLRGAVEMFLACTPTGTPV